MLIFLQIAIKFKKCYTNIEVNYRLILYIFFHECISQQKNPLNWGFFCFIGVLFVYIL